MPIRPRVLIDVSPRMFATALARILTERGYAVDVGGAPDHHDLAVLAEAGAEGPQAAVEIILPSLEESRVTARITNARGSRRFEVRNLEDLLVLIEAEAPLGIGVPRLRGIPASP
jgi:hypothetical protein